MAGSLPPIPSGTQRRNRTAGTVSRRTAPQGPIGDRSRTQFVMSDPGQDAQGQTSVPQNRQTAAQAAYLGLLLKMWFRVTPTSLILRDTLSPATPEVLSARTSKAQLSSPAKGKYLQLGHDTRYSLQCLTSGLQCSDRSGRSLFCVPRGVRLEAV